MTVRVELLRFALSGVLGFCMDTLILYAGMLLGLGFHLARALSFVAAASFTWAFNRRVTFAGRAQAPQPLFTQWLHYLAMMAAGGAVNYMVSAWIYANSELAVRWPVLAIAAGSVAGLLLNFATARAWVFRAKGP
jgi:putative flippase GtrA